MKISISAVARRPSNKQVQKAKQTLKALTSIQRKQLMVQKKELSAKLKEAMNERKSKSKIKLDKLTKQLAAIENKLSQV